MTIDGPCHLAPSVNNPHGNNTLLSCLLKLSRSKANLPQKIRNLKLQPAQFIMEALHWIAIFLLSSLLLKLFLIPKSKHRDKLPPSPPSLPIIGHLHLIKKPLHRSFSLLSAQYGPIIYLRLGCRPTIIVSSPQLAEECFTTNDLALANRPIFPSLKELTNNYTTIASSNYGPSWRNLRKIATVHVLSNQRLLSSTSARNDEARHLVLRLFDRSANDKSAFRKVFLYNCNVCSN